MKKKLHKLQLFSVYLSGVVLLLHMVIPHHHHINSVPDYQSYEYSESVRLEGSVTTSNQHEFCDSLEHMFSELNQKDNRSIALSFLFFPITLLIALVHLLVEGRVMKNRYFIRLKFIIHSPLLSSSLSRRGPPQILSFL
ncbi:hypothetical protein K4L44_04020 [Halosquirtibacter laminarini]|uniref:Uncharacterized protein n=1 Tax=Halosquirtibacter laminarini TaxID=3374600 RepID=A0AC61NPK0_9BACT|nr:hypothetical protein K4L44_04020 [Prolixibacteraceae bacterium]